MRVRNVLKLVVAGGLVFLCASACLFDGPSPSGQQQQSDHTTVISTGDNSAIWVLMTVMTAAAFGLLFWAMNEKGRRERAEDHATIQVQLSRGEVPVLNGRPYVSTARPPVDEWDRRMLGR